MAQSNDGAEVAKKGDDVALALARALLAAIGGGIAALAVAYVCRLAGVSDWNLLETSAWGAKYWVPMTIFAMSAIGTALAIWLMRELATRFAIAAAAVALGIVAAIVLQYVIITSESVIDWVGMIVLVLGLAIVFSRAVAYQRKSRRKTFSEWVGKTWAAFAFGVVGAFVVSTLFLPYAAEFLRGPLLALMEAPIGSRADELEMLIERTEQLWTTIGALAAVFVFVAVADTVSPLLHKVLEALGLSENQIKLAKRMLLPVKGVVPKGRQISQLYAKEVQINRPTLRRQFPLINGAGAKARVKLIIEEQKTFYEGDDFSWTQVDGLLKSADIELTQCLFFVCALDKKQHPKMLCYGTGAELKQLFEATKEVPHRLGVTVSEQFVSALNRNDPDGVIAAVDSARKDLLKHHPHAEVLLSTALVSEKDSVQTVLKKMKECALSRILVMSDKAPLERGVIGAAEISDFLLNEADAAA